ncbi:MAG: sigma-70 family RNA polymerase sigma factor [Pirellulales bacterium]|nr:sigma-70 family RNA polymerase sigma factor [Pirellulales bacterium]
MGKNEEFVELLIRYQQRIFLFIFSLLPNRSNAEDVLQETALLLWKRFDEYESGTNFKAWACKIAYYKVLEFTRRQNTDRHRFSDEFTQRVAVMVGGEAPDVTQARQAALERCLEKLPSKDREVIRRRYRPGGSARTVAQELGYSIRGIYKALGRAHRMLYRCVQTALATEDHA